MSSPNPGRGRLGVAALIAVLSLVGYLTGSTPREATSERPHVGATPRAVVAPAPSFARPVERPVSLPPEATRTLELIEAGGPFPFDRDGVVFENREGRLPRKPRGYYREYTVKTAGERSRGARRIVAGESGERFYSEDHYETFVPVPRPSPR